MQKWAKIDLLTIVILVALALLIVFIKREDPYWYTGLCILGLLPVVIADFFKDREIKTNG